MYPRILLTGGTGFLGTHILKNLIKENRNLVVLVRKTSDLNRISSYGIHDVFVLEDNLSNLSDLFKLYSIETIIHVATEYGRTSAYSNVVYSNVYFPSKLVEMAIDNKLKLFINTDSYFSKFSNYGYLTNYVKSKRIFKDYLSTLTDIKVVNLVLEHVFGEFDKREKFISSVISSLCQNLNYINLTKGVQKRDFIYVDDVVSAYSTILDNFEGLSQFSDFEVGTGSSVSIKEFVTTLRDLLHSKTELKFGSVPERVNEILESQADLTGLKRLGWSHQFDVSRAIKKIMIEEYEKVI